MKKCMVFMIVLVSLVGATSIASNQAGGEHRGTLMAATATIVLFSDPGDPIGN